MTLNVPFMPILTFVPNEGHFFPMPFIKRNVGVQQPRWPFVMNEGSLQAKDLFAWYPMHPVSPGVGSHILDLTPGKARNMEHLIAPFDSTPDTSLLGGPSVRFKTVEFNRFDAGASLIPELNDGRAICISGWFETIDLGLSNRGMWIVDNSVSNNFIYIGHRPDVVGNPARVVHGSFGGAEAIADSATDLNDRKPHFIMGKFLATDDTRVYLDGIQDGSSSTVHNTRSGVDRIGIGRVNKVTPFDTGDGRWWDGRVYIGDVHDDVVRQMFEPDTRYDLYEEYGRTTYIDFGGLPAPFINPSIVQPMMTIVNQ